MTGQTDNSLENQLIQQLLDSDNLQDGLRLVAQSLINTAMLLERAAHLHAGSHERTTERVGYANGFKPRQFHSSLGALELRVPQVRDCDEPFRTSLLEKGSRTDRALKVAIAEMYLNGVSTRKVTRVMEELCGLEVTSTQVSRLTAQLDEEFAKWRERPLPDIAHLILDATYMKVRIDGAVRDCAVLTAIGVRRADGKRMALGVSAALSEAEVHWREFLVSLKKRGLGLPDSVTSDAHEGLRAALRACLNAAPWQRCQFHLQQNAQAYVPKVTMREPVAADIREIFNATDRPHAEATLERVVEKYRTSAPQLADWMERNIPEGLTVFSLAAPLRTRLRTSNMCEVLNRQIKRRTRVVGLFPNTNSILRLVTAQLIELSEDWETGKAYLTLTKTNDNSSRSQ